MTFFFFFFFSSRRRHTLSLRDWSADVCSSDLDLLALRPGRLGHKNLLQVLSCVGADLAMSAAGPRMNAAAGYLLALLELLALLSREQRAGWARLGKPPTPG